MRKPLSSALHQYREASSAGGILFRSYKSLVDAGELLVVMQLITLFLLETLEISWQDTQMGLLVGKLVCASNKNDVLTEFLETGH